MVWKCSYCGHENPDTVDKCEECLLLRPRADTEEHFKAVGTTQKLEWWLGLTEVVAGVILIGMAILLFVIWYLLFFE